jgi:hypothetical protein
MNRKAIVFCSLLLSFLQLQLKAQDFGAYPPSKQWKQINTDTVRVIFPAELEPQARRVAGLVHYMDKKNKQSIGKNQWKLDIILRNQTVISNGYVSIGPYRSEYYTTAPQQSDLVGSLPWTDQLTIHEYRHGMQYMNSTQGLTHVAYWLFGQNGAGVMSVLATPRWFNEGDAVVNETALSQQGRGRIPLFLLGYRTLELEGQRYDYYKVCNISYRDYVPNRYPTGYLMCSYGRNEYGQNLWRDVYSGGVKYWSLIYPFSHSLRRYTKLSTKKMYNKMLDTYGQAWRDEVAHLSLSASTTYGKTDRKKVYTDYTFPVVLKSEKILCRDESFDHTAQFSIIDSLGNKQVLTYQGYTTDDNFSYRNNLICWTSLYSDARWIGITYSDIVIYNMLTHKKRFVTTKGKYFTPDISPDGTAIVASKTTPDMHNTLVFLDMQTGKEIKKLKNKEKYFFTYPVYSSDGKTVYSAIRDSSGRMAMAKISIATDEIMIISPFSFHIIGKPVPVNGGVLSQASFSGIDNIYLIKDNGQGIYQATSVATGVAAPAFDSRNNMLVYPEFTTKGYVLKKAAFTPEVYKKIDIVEPVDMPNYFTQYTKAEGGNILDSTYNVSVATRDYPLYSHLLNIHSYSLYSTGTAYGLMVYSENMLNTLQANAGIFYNKNEKRPEVMGEVFFGQQYPIFRLGGTVREDATYKTGTTLNTHYLDQRLEAGLMLPLDLSRGNYSTQLINMVSFAQVFYTYTKENEYNIKKNFPGYISSFTFSNQQYAAKQNIYSHCGQTITLSYNGSVGSTKAQQFYTKGIFTFRGLMENHNLKFVGEYQKENWKNEYRYANNFEYPRGYESPAADNIYKFSAEYHLPLFYPDLGFKGIIFLSRVRIDAFVDYAKIQVPEKDILNNYLGMYGQNMNSLGGELIFDFQWLNLIQIPIGIRYSHALNNEQKSWVMSSPIEIFIPFIAY